MHVICVYYLVWIGYPILGLANAPIVETKFLELAMSLLDFSPRIPLGTFSILLICIADFKNFVQNLWTRIECKLLARMCTRLLIFQPFALWNLSKFCETRSLTKIKLEIVGTFQCKLKGTKNSIVKEKKAEIWLSPMTKAHTPTEMSQGQSDKTNNATKKFDHTAVADRLRTVSWSNYGHPTGVVNLIYGPNRPNPRNSRVIKRPHV